MSVIMAGVSVYLSVIMAKYCNFFATLCEIPTGTRPSVIVAKCRNCFATLCEITTGKISSVKLTIFLQVLFVLRVYASAQKIE
jgi:hypothetical protein